MNLVRNLKTVANEGRQSRTAAKKQHRTRLGTLQSDIQTGSTTGWLFGERTSFTSLSPTSSKHMDNISSRMDATCGIV
jgi:hypothetical protein